MNDFPFDHDSGKAMGRYRSNAKAEAGLERRKLREEIKALKHDNGRLLESLNSAESGIERLRKRKQGLVEVLDDALILIKSIAKYSDQPLFRKDAAQQVSQIKSVLRKE